MKLIFSGNMYRRWDGVILYGPGEVEVDDEIAEYLLKTYPDLFSKSEKKSIEEDQIETKEKKLKGRAKIKRAK